MCICVCIQHKTDVLLSVFVHTYMNDVCIGVPVICTNKKANKDLLSIFLI